MKPTLTYCTNVHPGETLEQVEASLDRFTVPLARECSGSVVPPGESFPVGLYLSAAAARELGEPGRLERFRGFLEERELRIATLNCFPYGGFHAERVKLDVYRPDWLDERRVAFTLAAAEALSRLAPAGAIAAISTLPGSCKRFGAGDEIERRIAANLARVALALDRLHRERSREIVLCLEPEPFCTLETSEEAVRFFARHVFGEAGRTAFVQAGGEAREAEASLRRHLGICVDACHQAVEFEDPAVAIGRLREAGIRIGKVQLSSALLVREPAASPERRDALERFAEPRYLHQVVVRNRAGRLEPYLDLSDFLALPVAVLAEVEEARVHFHVPIDRADLPPLATTRDDLEATIAAIGGATSCFEVETYTFPVLPDGPTSEARMVAALARELRYAAAETRRRQGVPGS